MKQGAIMETSCDAREGCPWLLALTTCGMLGTLGFVRGSFAVLLADLSRPLDLSPAH